ncbi:response regulator transcription factor [Prescottella agglutinans]|uniref:DNA-binding NarL/FixJ family response regulator n=1 Tax=Prescottella agglutinans TaxID=1644129 RepID=A0ABT6MGE9_9NOCA|nr:response regulator transcription factor [Prescottella agglutinans]MDH6283398.1 DNA-binding NarL/FixJ family response regulator [Prescottella agglutinans]
MSAVRVLLVDDHPVVRAGLRALLASHDGVEVVAEASSGEEAVAFAATAKPDVVLMDLRLGAGIDGAGATAQITAMPEPPRVVVLTTYDTDTDILRAVEAGASGYLLKDTAPQVLIDSVFAAARGETVLDRDVAQRLYRRMQQPRADLSAREVEVLGLVAQGLSNRAIAKQLFVSEATVKSHLVHAFTKLGVDSRTAAVAAARERGLIT